MPLVLDGTNGVSGVDGTASNPSLEGTDSNTGIFYPAADTVAIGTGGTERLRVDSSGNVGIATTSPDGGLDVEKQNSYFGDTTNGGRLYFRRGVDGSAVGRVGWISGSNVNFEIANDSGSGNILFQTNSAERMRLDASGNLGIGSTPVNSRRLTINTSGQTDLSIVAASNNYAQLLFGYTGADSKGIIAYYNSDNSMQFYTNGAERARITSGGSLLVGVTSGQGKVVIANADGANAPTTVTAANSYLHIGSGDFGPAGNGKFMVAFGYTGTSYTNAPAYIGFEETTGVGGTKGYLSFYTRDVTTDTAPTERARIDSVGDFFVGKTTASTSTNGFQLTNSGTELSVGRSSDRCALFNRNTTDGNIVLFLQDGVQEGSISVSGNTVSYNPFLGSHAGAFADWSRPEVKIGTIFETINELIDYKVVVIEVEDVPKRISYNGNGAVGTTATVEYEGQEYTGIIENERGQLRDFNKHVKVKINDTPDSKAVYGVFVGWNTDPSNDGGVYNDMLIGAVGNYVIRMAAGQTPEIGDLVKADGTGCAIVQEDDIVRTKTVGKITNTIPQLTYEDGSFLVACVLYCG